MTGQTLNNKTIGLQLILLVSAFLLSYWQTIVGLYQQWSTDGDYSYAFLIPAISAYLIWERRHKLGSTPIASNWVGGVFFFVFLVISAYGILGSSPSAVRPAIPLIILSITLFCFGTEVFKVIWLPLAYLIFMIPLPTLFGTLIGVHLKLISTQLGKLILQIFGVSVFVEGNVIDLGITQLQVVDACSGLRYLLPLLALGVIFAYMLERVRWKQVVLVLSAIPIAVITNGIRIGITGLLAHYYSLEAAEGFFHGFSGWLIFMVAFALLFALYVLLRVLFREAPTENPSISGNEAERGAVLSRNNTISIVISSVFLLVLALVSYTTAALPTLAIRGGLSNFPLSIKTWKGEPEKIDTEMIVLSGAQEAFSATYRKGSGNLVSLYIGYRGSPFLESANFFHSPYVCLPSGGWKTLQIGNHAITDVTKFGTITVRKMLSESMGQRQVVYYWFQTKSRTSFDVNINRFHLAWHAIQRDNTHDLFIRTMSPFYPNEKMQDAENRMDQFARDMMAALLDFLAERQADVLSQ